MNLTKILNLAYHSDHSIAGSIRNLIGQFLPPVNMVTDWRVY